MFTVPRQGATDAGSHGLLDGILVEGTVLGPTGPLPGAEVRPGRRQPVVNVVMDDAGRYVAIGLPGDVLPWVNRDGVALTYWPDADRPDTFLSAPDEGAVVSDADLFPPAEAVLSFRFLDPTTGTPSQGCRAFSTTTPAPSGAATPPMTGASSGSTASTAAPTPSTPTAPASRRPTTGSGAKTASPASPWRMGTAPIPSTSPRRLRSRSAGPSVARTASHLQRHRRRPAGGRRGCGGRGRGPHRTRRDLHYRRSPPGDYAVEAGGTRSLLRNEPGLVTTFWPGVVNPTGPAPARARSPQHRQQ